MIGLFLSFLLFWLIRVGHHEFVFRQKNFFQFWEVGSLKPKRVKHKTINHLIPSNQAKPVLVSFPILPAGASSLLYPAGRQNPLTQRGEEEAESRERRWLMESSPCPSSPEAEEEKKIKITATNRMATFLPISHFLRNSVVALSCEQCAVFFPTPA